MADRSPPLLTQLWQQVHFEMKDALHQAIALPRRDWFKSQASPATGVGRSALYDCVVGGRLKAKLSAHTAAT